MARRFGRDFGTYELTLSLLKLRLSRWGEASHVYDNHSIDDPAANTAEAILAKQTLGQIQFLLEDSRRIADAYDNDTVSTPADSDIHLVTQKLRGLALKRQRKTSTLKLAKWALYDRSHCDELVERISKLLEQLESVLVNNDDTYRLAAAEIKQICEGNLSETQRTLRVVLGLASKFDRVLEEMAKDTTSAAGIPFGSMVVTEDARVHNNDTITAAWRGVPELPSSQSSITIGNFRAEGNARVANGRRYVESDDFWGAP
ncbi:hypothetical protein CcaCcLH18_03222 [Colletotrichum camelliae]|nr:hypothetical protein CcaCcLH18_03222 [Colletotrichum camelliae]